MRNVLLLGLTSLLTDVSSEMIIPLLPFFITSLGGAGVAIGLITGVGDGLAAVLKVVSGRIADRTKEYKHLAFLGYAFSAAAKFFYPFASMWQHVLAIRPIERLGKGIRDAPRDAIVSESLGTSSRGMGFGIQRAMDSMGAIIGSFLVLFFFWFFQYSFRTIFLIAAIIGLTTLIPLLFVTVPTTLRGNTSRLISLPQGFGLNRLSPQLKKFIVVASLFYLASFSYLFFILKSSEIFEFRDARTAIALPLLLYIFFNIFDAAFSTFAGALSDRIGRTKVLAMGYGLFSLVCVGFIFAKSFLFSLVLFAGYGLFKAFIDASQRAFVADLSLPENRGISLGIFEASTGLALIPGGLIAGVLWNHSPNATFLYGFFVSFLAVLLLVRLVRPARS